MLKYVAPLEQQLRHYIPKHEHPTSVSTGEQETTGQRLAEHVAAGIGSWRFIGAQAALMVVWVLVNTLQFTGAIHFDAFPFVFLNLTMSAEAAFTGPILLVAANIGAIRDHKQFDRMEHLERHMEDMEENMMSLLNARLPQPSVSAPAPAPASPAPTPPKRSHHKKVTTAA